MSPSTFIIAEAGVNHDGDPMRARRLIDIAADAGADAVKFQTFTAEALAGRAAPKAAYQRTTTRADESQYDMLRRLELSRPAHRKLHAYCGERSIEFLSSAFDVASLEFLALDMSLPTLKIPSGEITNGPLLHAAGRSGRRIILSTGMSTLDEVGEALGAVALGMTMSDETPSRAAIRSASANPDFLTMLRERVILLHCTSEYPAPAADANLRAMDTLRRTFGVSVGWSDHTEGIAVAIAAVALGAVVIEKHFTDDKHRAGPDHRASLEPRELADMVASIRSVEQALGDGIKAPRPSELKNRDIVRQSLIVEIDVRAGEKLTAESLGSRRPGTGISPMSYWDWLGRQVEIDLEAGDQVPQ